MKAQDYIDSILDANLVAPKRRESIYEAIKLVMRVSGINMNNPSESEQAFINTEVLNALSEDIFEEQKEALRKYASIPAGSDNISIEYYQPYNSSYGLSVGINQYVMETIFCPRNGNYRNEIKIQFFFTIDDYHKPMMMRQSSIPESFVFLRNRKDDYYYVRVSNEKWADDVIQIVEMVKANLRDFVKLCNVSCPYREDGMHKYKSWTNYATVTIVYGVNDEIAQGFKNGESPQGTFSIGSNGTFLIPDNNYYLQYTVDAVAGERPIRQDGRPIKMDTLIRELLKSIGRKRFSEKLLKELFPRKLKVVTFNMDKDPIEREFVPFDYNHNWEDYLCDCFQKYKQR